MNRIHSGNPLLWLCLLLLAWAVLGVQLAAPKVASGPFYAATEHHLGGTRWEAAPRLGLDAWTTNFASGDTVGAKATGTTGKVKIEPGAIPDSNEVRAGQGLSGLGYDVTHQTTASAKGIQGQRTADLHVDGIGTIDVYTPQNISPSSIVRAIEKKANQAGGVLVQADLPGADMSSIAARMWGKTNAQNIKTIFFQKSDGSVIRFDRPSGGS